MPYSVEVLNPRFHRGPYPIAVFDFDGTVSLIREGWSSIMADIGVELLDDQSRHAALEMEMLRLSGKPSIFQMRRLAELVIESRKSAPTPGELLNDFSSRLIRVTESRRRGLVEGTATPEEWAVPGTHQLLESIQDRGSQLILVSGTPIESVRHEARLLDLTRFFGDQVFAPNGDTPNFNKRDVIDQLVTKHGTRIIGFGDGYAETVEMKRVGGTTVGVASQQVGMHGINPMKRAMLIDLGADLIVPNYSVQDQLVPWLYGEL